MVEPKILQNTLKSQKMQKWNKLLYLLVYLEGASVAWIINHDFEFFGLFLFEISMEVKN